MREQHDPDKDQHSLQGDGQNKRSFGHYDLVRRIDVGGMGEVYLARQRTAFGREVALKVIRSDLVHDITARKRFLREAEVSAHLKHDHILPLYEFGEEQGRLFLVTPYIEGGTLARRLQAGSLTLSETHQLFTALAMAVAYVHKRGVVHRDLKPTNILLDTEEETGQVYVRLIDFGIASLPGIVSDAALTTAGHEMGTVAYMAPERLNGIAAPSNDIYSLGMILYQMLTRRLPGEDPAIMLPRPLNDIVQHAIALDPRDRIATADELRYAFEDAYPAARVIAENVMTPCPEMVLVPLPGPRFSRSDYNAPTTSIGPSDLSARQVQRVEDTATITTKPPTHSHNKRRRPSALVIVPILIIVILLVIAGTIFLTVPAFASAKVVVSPQVHPISDVYTLTASPDTSSIDVNGRALPANTLKLSQTFTKTGP